MERFLKIAVGASVVLAVAALVATAFMVLTADRGGEVSRDGGVPAPAATAMPVSLYEDPDYEEDPNPPREIPDLTENQIAEVKRLLKADPNLNSLLAGESYAVLGMGPWVSGGKEREFIGALVDVELDNPVSFNGVLPIAISYEKPVDSDELYFDGGQMSLRAQGIEKLSVLVDLNKGKVITIEVSKSDNIIYYDDWGNPN